MARLAGLCVLVLSVCALSVAGYQPGGGGGRSREKTTTRRNPFTTETTSPFRRTEPSGPPTMALLTAGARQELRLTAEQEKQLEEVGDRWRLANQAANSPTSRARTLALYEKAVRAILNPQQVERLDQLHLQQDLKGDDLFGVFLHERAVRRLGLTEDQERKRDEILSLRRRELGRLFLETESAKLSEKLEAFHKETRARLEAVLTRPQREQLGRLLGPTYRGTASGGNTARRASALHMKIFVPELSMLNAPGLSGALKLTAAQQAKLADLYQRTVRQISNGGFGGLTRGTPTDDQLKAFEKELVGELGANLRRRFRQIVLQTLEKQATNRTRSLSNLWRIEEIIQGLKLTDDQRTRLQDGAGAEEVLTEAQKKSWKEMKGEVFEGDLFPAQPRVAARVRTPTIPFQFVALLSSAIRQELGLTPVQVAALDQAQRQWTADLANYAATKPEDRPAKLDQAQRVLEGEIDRILQPAQRKRYQQILLQQVHLEFGSKGEPTAVLPISSALGSRVRSQSPSLAAVLLYTQTAKDLGLGVKQIQDLHRIVKDAHLVGARIAPEFARLPMGELEDLDRQTQLAHAARTEGAIRGVLTEKQRAALADLIGPPFSGTILPNRANWGRFGSND